ncbi:MAG: Mrp/NBP35 family ATP-binding protein [Tannerellaceae bacterium]|nr:Mrp/NBP35 family ATP-binding protein [Tannerellaceae bacterium]
MKVYPKLILEALEKVRYPGTGKDIVALGMVNDDIRIDGNSVSFSISFDKQNDPFIKSVIKAAEAAIITYVDKDIDIKGRITAVARPKVQPVAAEILPGVKHIIAVASGKGGVGKSTIAANLAVAFAVKGYSVGLLDADIYGPSQPKMFCMEDVRPLSVNVDGRDLIEPVENYGVKLLSIGFFIEKESAVLWRGPMAGNAFKQLTEETDWGELDFLLIDLPPGTSDIHLTMAQTLKLAGAIIVTTPQAVALADARKGYSMFVNDKINVPVLGLVENMAWFTPAELPENKYYIFGKDGGKFLAEQLGVPLLGQIPIVESIRESGDSGMPVALEPDSVTGAAFHFLAQRIAERLA